MVSRTCVEHVSTPDERLPEDRLSPQTRRTIAGDSKDEEALGNLHEDRDHLAEPQPCEGRFGLHRIRDHARVVPFEDSRAESGHLDQESTYAQMCLHEDTIPPDRLWWLSDLVACIIRVSMGYLSGWRNGVDLVVNWLHNHFSSLKRQKPCVNVFLGLANDCLGENVRYGKMASAIRYRDMRSLPGGCGASRWKSGRCWRS